MERLELLVLTAEESRPTGWVWKSDWGNWFQLQETGI